MNQLSGLKLCTIGSIVIKLRGLFPIIPDFFWKFPISNNGFRSTITGRNIRKSVLGVRIRYIQPIFIKQLALIARKDDFLRPFVFGQDSVALYPVLRTLIVFTTTLGDVLI